MCFGTFILPPGEPVYQKVKMSNTHLNPVDGSSNKLLAFMNSDLKAI